MSFFDDALPEQLGKALESALNLALKMDPGSQKRLNSLKGCILEIRVSRPQQSLFFSSDGDRVILSPRAQSAHVVLAGSPLAFLKLATYTDKSTLFRTREISMSGDAVRAQQIQRFMQTLNIDWEGLLAEVIGDVPAHALVTSLMSGINWSKNFSRSVMNDLEEYVKYELRLLPGRKIGKAQFEAIDQLRLATDRLEARVRKLIQKSETN